jgi:hypothetical protein
VSCPKRHVELKTKNSINVLTLLLPTNFNYNVLPLMIGPSKKVLSISINSVWVKLAPQE